MGIDISALIGTPVAPMATVFEVLPDGEYMATVDASVSLDKWFGAWTNPKGEEIPTCNVPFVVHDEELAKKLGRDKLTTRLGLFLDMEGGQLATGKGQNVLLGQLRDALGQNADPAWTFQKLSGAGPVKIVTKNSRDKNGREFSNVTRVVKA